VQSLKRKHKDSKQTNNGNTQHSFKSIPLPDYSHLPAFERNFYFGDSHPSMDELKSIRKSIGVLVKGDDLEKCPAPILDLTLGKLPDVFPDFFKRLSLKSPSPVQMQVYICTSIFCVNTLCSVLSCTVLYA